MSTVVPQFTNLLCFMIWGQMAAFVFVWGRWPWLCLSSDVAFTNGSKIFAEHFVYQLNCLQTEAFVNRGVTALDSSHL